MPFLAIKHCKFVYFVGYSSDSVTNDIVRQKRSELFGQEKARQLALVSRIEKIEVRHVGPPEDCVLLMNKGLSTPFNCAMRECLCFLYRHSVHLDMFF